MCASSNIHSLHAGASVQNTLSFFASLGGSVRLHSRWLLFVLVAQVELLAVTLACLLLVVEQDGVYKV